MKVFVILVNYNGCKDTLECINSLLKVKYSKMKIIVVDNASSDESVSELKKYDEKITLMISPANGGFSKGNNIGIKYALKEGADYILLLNNDTIVDENFLNPLLDTAAEYKNTAVVSSKIYYESDHEKIWFAGGSFNKVTGRLYI